MLSYYISLTVTKLFGFSIADAYSGRLDESKWLLEAGGERTASCGSLLSGKAIVFAGKEGERLLQTVDLDLTHAT